MESIGWIFLLIIPGAFVEPNEESLDKSDWKTKLRVFAAGSTGNFMLFAIVLGFTTILFVPAFFSGNINFAYYANHTKYNLSEPFPANKLNITPGIIAVDGNKIENVDEFVDLINKKSPGDTISLTTMADTSDKFKTYEVNLSQDPKNKTRAFLGIVGVEYVNPTNVGCSLTIPAGFWNNLCATPKSQFMNYAPILLFLRKLLTYIMVLNLGIGVFNLLPIKPLDGGLMLETLSERFIPKHSERIVSISRSLMIAVILV
ncbi:MAG: M50 family metallopeptidase, partial [Candidatus Aenigmatarchaeota archaeon]